MQKPYAPKELLLVYVDDVLLISKNPDEVMKKIGETFRLKEGYGEPTTYLGAETSQHVAEDGSTRWVLGSGKYVKNIVEQVKEMLELDGRSLKVPNSEKKQDNVGPLHPDYKPELDASDLLDEGLHARYQQKAYMLDTNRSLVCSGGQWNLVELTSKLTF